MPIKRTGPRERDYEVLVTFGDHEKIRERFVLSFRLILEKDGCKVLPFER